MDAFRLLRRMCERHGIALGDAQDLVPLISQALLSPERVRTKILAMIEDNLARRSRGDATATTHALEKDLDEEVLLAVSRTLHDWKPPARMETFGQVFKGKEDLEIDPDDLPGGLGGGL